VKKRLTCDIFRVNRSILTRTIKRTILVRNKKKTYTINNNNNNLTIQSLVCSWFSIVATFREKRHSIELKASNECEATSHSIATTIDYRLFPLAMLRLVLPPIRAIKSIVKEMIFQNTTKQPTYIEKFEPRSIPITFDHKILFIPSLSIITM
jgi:hypothetical protein